MDLTRMIGAILCFAAIWNSPKLVTSSGFPSEGPREVTPTTPATLALTLSIGRGPASSGLAVIWTSSSLFSQPRGSDGAIREKAIASIPALRTAGTAWM